MAKITITTTTTIAYLLIAAAAADPPPVAAPPPQVDCFRYLSDAGDCLDFVVSGSKLRKPARNCCPELGNLTGTHPVCLCQLLSNSSQFGFSIDTNQALKLPSLCNISIPSITLCQDVPLAIIPNPSPAKAPESKKNPSPTISLLPYDQRFLIGLLLILYMSVYY